MFAISFSEDPPYWDGGALHREGVTLLGDERDWFAAPLDFWQEAAYEAQWREGVERIVAGAETSALVTRMEDPAQPQVLQFWELYRVDELVAVHERLWLDFGRLRPDEIYGAVGSYRRENQNGQQVSEWRLPVSDFADYLSGRL